MPRSMPCPAHPFRGALRSAAAVAGAFALAALVGCSPKPPKGLPKGDRAPLADFDRVIVLNFRDGVSNQDKSTRAIKRSTMNDVVRKFAQRIADATEALHAFESVERSGKPNGRTLVVTGVITAYRRGNQLEPLPIVGKAFDDTREFRAQIDLIDGGDRRIMTTFPVDMASLPPTGPAYRGMMRGPAETVAAKLYELKLGTEVPASHYVGQHGTVDRAPDRRWREHVQ